VFFITDDGYLISNYHVVKAATKVRLVTSAGTVDAKVVQVDTAMAKQENFSLRFVQPANPVCAL